MTPYTLFAIQILNSLDIRFTKTPVPGAKMHPEMPGNKYFSSFGQLWVIQSPPPYFRIISSKVFRSRLLLGHSSKNASPVSPRINGKCKCKQTSNEYRQTPPNTQCCLLLELCSLLYFLFPIKQKSFPSINNLYTKYYNDSSIYLNSQAKSTNHVSLA